MKNSKAHLGTLAVLALASMATAAAAQSGPFGAPIVLTKPLAVVEKERAAAPAPAWPIASGSRLKATLETWGKSAGWKVVWLPEADYMTAAGASFSGTFTEAVQGLFMALPADVHIRAELRPDNVPPLVLVTRDEGGR